MLISELIEKLIEIQKDLGDVQVVYLTGGENIRPIEPELVIARPGVTSEVRQDPVRTSTVKMDPHVILRVPSY